MIKFVVAKFNTETAAFKGLTALKDLHRNGDITLYASAVLAKNACGVISIKQAADSGPIGTATGMLAGALIGGLGGPIGMAAGASAGILSGAIYDAFTAGIDAHFLNDVSSSLAPGDVAIACEIDEAWTAPLDSRIHEIGGVLFRRMKSEAAEDAIARESAALEAEAKSLQEELSAAAANQKAAIEKSIEANKAQIKAVQEQAKARLDKIKAETEGRLNRAGFSGGCFV